jgi:MFS family permease
MKDPAIAIEPRQITPNMQRLAYLAWGLTAFFYFYIYILRTVPGVIVDSLRQEFAMTAEQFSAIGAFYLYAYAFLQIPLGIMLDRVGIKLVLSVSVFFCAFGACLLAVTDSLWFALASRVLMGIGSAAPFMCAVKIIADYLPAGKRGIFVGATLSFGTIGPLVVGKPIAALITHFTWRPVMLGLGMAGVALLVIILFWLPSNRAAMPKTKRAAEKNQPTIRQQLLGLLRHRTILTYSIIALGLYTPLSVMIDLWGTAFISERYGLSNYEAASIAMMGYLGLTIGSPLITWLAEKHNQLVRTVQICGFMVLACFAVILYVPLSSSMLVTVFVLLGIFCGAEMLCFTGVSLYTTPTNSGITLGFVNTLNMLGGGVLQQTIGAHLDWQWQAEPLMENGIRVYNAAQYTSALAVLIPVLVVTGLLSLRLKKASH